MALLTDVPLIRTKPIRDTVYEQLREAIVKGTMTPGTFFTDSQIADELKISRTPVREAVQKLEAEGLIERSPMKGNKVTGVDPTDVAHIFAIRKALESLAVRYVAISRTEGELAVMRGVLDQAEKVFAQYAGEARADGYVPLVSRFNRAMFDASHVKRLTDLIWSHRELLDRFRVIRAVIVRRLEESLETREQMYQYFLRHDADQAGKLWASHIDGSYRIWVDVSGYGDCTAKAQFV